MSWYDALQSMANGLRVAFHNSSLAMILSRCDYESVEAIDKLLETSKLLTLINKNKNEGAKCIM